VRRGGGDDVVGVRNKSARSVHQLPNVVSGINEKHWGSPTVNRTNITAAAVTLVALAAVSLSGCAASDSGGSRAELYDSVTSLAGDSSIVLAGTVQDQRTASDIPGSGEFTLSTVVVSATAKTDADHPAGSTVVVRQQGTANNPGPGAMLTEGTTYLLYLTPSGLDGDLASHFSVTGGTAGIYAAEQDPTARGTGGVTDSTEFTKAPSDEGDDLPAQLTLGTALRG
jgi:hypothetical protein